MKTPIPTKFSTYSSIVVLVTALLISACANGESRGTAGNSNTPAATRNTIAKPTSKVFIGPVIYVALGASDAVGVGSSSPGSQGYVPLLAARLPKGSHLVNLGISGIHLHEALSQELPLALTTTPDLVTIWLVANDFVAGVPYNQYIQDLNLLLQRLRANTHARLVMANLPNLTLLPAFADQTPSQKTLTLQEIQRWNAGIAGSAVRYGVTLVDLFSHQSQLTAHPEYVSSDGFHPSPSGYVQLANYFWQAIEQ